MPCDPEELKHVPLFELLDEEELAVLAAQVDMKKFAARQRIFKMGEPSRTAYILMSGSVRVTTVDEDQQEVVIDEPGHGGFFGFASMLDQTIHQASAMAMEESVCLEMDRHDIQVLVERKPLAGLDMLTMLGRQLHASQRLIQLRAHRNPNEVIEQEATFGERIADSVARFGGSWNFIISFGVVLVVVFRAERSAEGTRLGSLSIHPVEPFSIDAGVNPGSGHHDEPEPAGHKRPPAQRAGFRCESTRRK